MALVGRAYHTRARSLERHSVRRRGPGRGVDRGGVPAVATTTEAEQSRRADEDGTIVATRTVTRATFIA